jgi:hypothetical protein
VLFNRAGTKLVGTLVGTSQISSFTVGFSGRLTEAQGSPFPAQGRGPFGSEFRPTNPSQLFVSNAHNVAAGTRTVSAFNDSSGGVLSSIGPSPFANQQTAPCWVQISPDGRFLFSVDADEVVAHPGGQVRGRQAAVRLMVSRICARCSRRTSGAGSCYEVVARCPACHSSFVSAAPGSSPKLRSWGRSRRLRLSSAKPGNPARPVT